MQLGVIRELRYITGLFHTDFCQGNRRKCPTGTVRILVSGKRQVTFCRDVLRFQHGICRKSRGVIYHCVRFFVSWHGNITGKSRDFALYTVLLPGRIAGDIAVCIAGNAFCCSTVTAGYHIFCLTIIAGYRIFFRHIRFAAGHLFCKQHIFLSFGLLRQRCYGFAWKGCHCHARRQNNRQKFSRISSACFSNIRHIFFCHTVLLCLPVHCTGTSLIVYSYFTVFFTIWRVFLLWHSAPSSNPPAVPPASGFLPLLLLFPCTDFPF